MLDFNQRNELIDALTNDFNEDLLRSMLFKQLNRKLEHIVPGGKTYPQLVEILVSEAIQQGWDWALIKAAIAANTNGPTLMLFIAKHPTLDPSVAQPLPPDHIMAQILRGGRYFIDRKHLREAMKELRTGERRVLVVTGERVSGKTYTRELINFHSERTPKQRAIYIDLDRYAYDAKSLTEDIGQLIGMDLKTIPKQDNEQKARWALRLCSWVIAHINNPGDTTHWFVFDGFRDRTLLSETRDWIEELAVQAETNVPQCRVVLLNYNEPLPFQISDYVGREVIKPIERDELVDFFEQLNVSHKTKYQSADLTSKVDVILQQVDQALAKNPKSPRLKVLTCAVKETAALLFA